MTTARVLVILVTLAVGPAAIVDPLPARAQEESEAADALFQPTDEVSKDQMSARSHCGASNATSATFSGITTWHLCFDAVSRFGLIVRLADFKRSPAGSPIRIAFDLRLAEIFVPYHPGSPRFFDISGFNFPLLTLTSRDCPLPRQIVGGGKVCREIRDRGLLWKDDARVRRSSELVLWSVLDAANYNYVIEWSFRDDGSIGGRAGSTGPKLGGPDDTRGHMHNFTWRLDIDLNGSAGDTVLFTRHQEVFSPPPSRGVDQEFAITAEGGRVWTATQYNTLKVVDATLRNGRGRQTAYELVPLRTGAARHTESYTQSDFWVTRFNPSELFGSQLSNFVTPAQPTVNQDITIWYTGSVHHEGNMRDEDRDTVPVLWTAFELVPHNLFDRTPLFP